MASGLVASGSLHFPGLLLPSSPVCTHLLGPRLARLVLLIAAFPLISSRAVDPPVWGFDTVVGLAAQLAASPHAAPEKLPKPLRELSYDDLRKIRYAPREAIWRMERLPFQLQFFHPGGLQKDRIIVNQVEGEKLTPLPFSEDLFEYGDIELRGRIPASVGFSGFRIHYPLNKPDYLDELAAFQGASYFRVLSKDAIYGISSRALGIRIAEGEREEFPRFREFWVEQPDRSAKQIRLWGMFDSESAAGAAEFVIRPGVITEVDVRVAVFLRKDVENLGLAPLTSMFWYGENSPYKFGDFRPEVHDSDGALIHTGAGEWLWRPLANETNRFRWSAFADAEPRGFGLIQRDRAFSSYEDLEALYHLRPSVWVEPAGQGWGPGEIRLVELPSLNEYGDNVNLFFVPSQPARAGERFDLAYRLHAFLEEEAWPPSSLGRVVSTRQADIPYNRRATRFLVDFARPRHAGDLVDEEILIEMAADRAQILGTFIQRNDYAGTWRVVFDIEAASTNLPAELRCTLRTDAGPLTETWTYQWMPPRF